MIGGIVFLAVGSVMTWLAILNWRHRKQQKISLLEAAILRTTGAEPLPMTKFDRALQWFQIIMMSLFGPVITLLGIAILIGELL